MFLWVWILGGGVERALPGPSLAATTCLSILSGHHWGGGFNNWSCLLERGLASSGSSLTGAGQAPCHQSHSCDAGGVKEEVFSHKCKETAFPKRAGWGELGTESRCVKGHVALLWGQHSPVSAGEAEGRLKSNDESSKNVYNHFCLTTEIKTN